MSARIENLCTSLIASYPSIVINMGWHVRYATPYFPIETLKNNLEELFLFFLEIKGDMLHPIVNAPDADAQSFFTFQ